MIKRNKDQVIAEILEICQREGVVKTHIAYGCNLNLKNIGIYCKYLVHAGLLEGAENTYRTTQKGMEALGHITAFRT